MKKFARGLLSVLILISLMGCANNGGPLPADAGTAPAVTHAIWENDPRYRPSVGKVEIACGDVTFTPIANYLNSMEYSQGGWLCADGRSLMYEHDLTELEQNVTVLNYMPEVTVKLIGGNGRLAYFHIHDKEYKRIYDGIPPKGKAILQLPDDDRICYICVVVSWVADLPPPGEKDIEYIGMEYLFKVKYK